MRFTVPRVKARCGMQKLEALRVNNYVEVLDHPMLLSAVGGASGHKTNKSPHVLSLSQSCHCTVVDCVANIRPVQVLLATILQA